MSEYEFDLSLFTMGDYLEFITLASAACDPLKVLDATEEFINFIRSFLKDDGLLMATDMFPMTTAFTTAVKKEMGM